MSPVAVSFKLRKFKCKIAEKKKMKVKLIDRQHNVLTTVSFQKLIAEMNIIYNRKFYSFVRIDQKFKKYQTDENHHSYVHLKDLA